ncbi:putative Rna polymerase C1 [Cardiosporidium cionae]|uniref:DNA-directed RNA polymerase subunit n=1 Tax=Cardiosporidium cionae TaxID=476202 RepID=A0ABQ7J5Z5_9APIC|nr:putative Rna polymerase C1 [Cardiosporidium cionae]|eukprot:KAF8819416.1 putative Rna polymerase C1 [Cardiosporidium cionae]
MGKTALRDGRTGIALKGSCLFGCSLYMKLIHMIKDKIHYRTIGPYSSITQQPIKGRSKKGGQRFGEMEVWALEAFGSAYNLKELLSIKSDDIKGRSNLQEYLLYNYKLTNSSIPESFRLMLTELKGLALNIEALIYSDDTDTIRSSTSKTQICEWATRYINNNKIEGEVTEPLTINFKKGIYEKNEKIFGPVFSWKCKCGLYKGRILNHSKQSTFCEQCGPGRVLSTLLDIPLSKLENLIYYKDFFLKPDFMKLIKNKSFNDLNQGRKEGTLSWGYSQLIMSNILLQVKLKNLNILTELNKTRDNLIRTNRSQKRSQLSKKIRILNCFFISNIKPEWIFLEVLPVIPPQLRPFTKLNNNLFINSPINNLYRLILIRNNRLKRWFQCRHFIPLTFEIIEKKMLQQSVDNLLSNKLTQKPFYGDRPKLSLSTTLAQGKYGRFRHNLLGKRIDFSGRSVIVSGADLPIGKIGLPYELAFNLFNPLLQNIFQKNEKLRNIFKSITLLQYRPKIIKQILKQLLSKKVILINRAPTLHKMNIQAFQPYLIERDALKLFPLSCSSFNADFDGDQMGIFLPLSKVSQYEAKYKVASDKNYFSFEKNKNLFKASQSMILGLYLLTAGSAVLKPLNLYFTDHDDLLQAYFNNLIELNSFIWIKVQQIISNKIFINFMLTTPGFDYALKYSFSLNLESFKNYFYLNELLRKNENIRLTSLWKYSTSNITSFNLTFKTSKIFTKFFEFIDEYKKINSKDTTLHLMITTGIRGYLSNIQGHLYEIPVMQNFSKGLNLYEYFISCYGARKGVIDTAIKTADSGYLTRRLIEVSRTKTTLYYNCNLDLSGRTICNQCYNYNISSNRNNLGESVGILAAQSIGEPGTQLTLRTFHTGGVFTQLKTNKYKNKRLEFDSSIRPFIFNKFKIFREVFTNSNKSVIDLGENQQIKSLFIQRTSIVSGGFVAQCNESLCKQYINNGIRLPTIHFELIAKKMTSCVKLTSIGDTAFKYNDILPFNLIHTVNMALAYHGYTISYYKPHLLGISRSVLAYSGFLSASSFQETIKTLINSALESKVDWITDLKTRIMFADLITSGSGSSSTSKSLIKKTATLTKQFYITEKISPVFLIQIEIQIVFIFQYLEKAGFEPTELLLYSSSDFNIIV